MFKEQQSDLVDKLCDILDCKTSIYPKSLRLAKVDLTDLNSDSTNYNI